MPRLSATVVWLGLVSLLTDASGEMIYSLLPLFLTGVLHASIVYVGAIEGAAESTAALLKIFAGSLSDRLARRKPLVVLGYGLASCLRPLVGLASSPLGVLLIRLGDRVGKGVRSGPRDALLADVTPSGLRGRAYGLHRAMDNAGAVVGPLVAYTLLGAGLALRRVFLLAAVPGALAMATLLLCVRERPRAPAPQPDQPAPFGAASILPRRGLPPALRRYFVALFFFSLGNSSDALLIVWASAVLPATQIPLLWMAHNAVKALLSTPLGALSDRWGRRRIILASWGLYALIYLGFATLHGTGAVWGLFLGYGVYYALLEGTEKALVADLAPALERGRVFGWFHSIVGITALPASLLGAELYQRGPHGPLQAFGTGALLAGVAALVLLTVQEPPRRP